ncbi:MAG: quinone-dependent dihydroorotate dehydrogenase [Ktedonobacterales bacterium]|nr:quinone-dependent dihydroorotate dehydrogenase [Ktedonobacterales bacterium]
MYQAIVRPALFRWSAHDPEIIHHQMMAAMELAAHLPPLLRVIQAVSADADPKLARQVFGLRFPNPVGLAGGFDKNGRALATLAALGFGFIEAGGVTRFAQAGQPRPRIFRLPADGALINRMGLPNEGAEAIAQRLLSQPRPAVPIGWQLAKSKVTPLADATEDYLYSLRTLYPFADYFTLNVSSPNTPGLRQLQERGPLTELLTAVVTEAQRLAGPHLRPKPILVKIAPDLSESALDDVLAVALATGISGLIATNTTVTREGLHADPGEAGGLSGRPLFTRSLAVVRHLVRALDGRLPVIGVGGIFGPDDARRMLDAGAALIQIYTGFIYEGPGIIRRINHGLAAHQTASPRTQEVSV